VANPGERRSIGICARKDELGNRARKGFRSGIRTAWLSPPLDERPFEEIANAMQPGGRPGVAESTFWPVMSGQCQFVADWREMSRSMQDLPRVRAPEFPSGLDWIHTGGKGLTLESLRGKVILLDFWTYG
jgi:hypothetical protein